MLLYAAAPFGVSNYDDMPKMATPSLCLIYGVLTLVWQLSVSPWDYF
jgi:hypothetical protein